MRRIGNLRAERKRLLRVVLVTSEQIQRFFGKWFTACLVTGPIHIHNATHVLLLHSPGLCNGCSCTLRVMDGHVCTDLEEGYQKRWKRIVRKNEENFSASKETIKPGAIFSVAPKPGTVSHFVDLFYFSASVWSYPREGIIFFPESLQHKAKQTDSGKESK